MIVYGTVAEAGTNRYAAEKLQTQFREQNQADVAIRKDFEVSEEDLRHRDVIFVGRPETNSALAAWSAKIGLHYGGAVLQLNGETYGSERNSLAIAEANPLDSSHMVLVFAGNDPQGTVESLNANFAKTATVLEDGKPLVSPASMK